MRRRRRRWKWAGVAAAVAIAGDPVVVRLLNPVVAVVPLCARAKLVAVFALSRIAPLRITWAPICSARGCDAARRTDAVWECVAASLDCWRG